MNVSTFHSSIPHFFFLTTRIVQDKCDKVQGVIASMTDFQNLRDGIENAFLVVNVDESNGAEES